MSNKANNLHKHPPRRASHPWKAGAAWRMSRERQIAERKAAKAKVNS